MSNTTAGRKKERKEKAWVLAVVLQFKDEEAAATVLEAWEKLADYCFENEPILYHFEVAQSDQDPLKYNVFERYESKEAYLTIHKASDAFKEFKKVMVETQERDAVAINGSSYNELGQGFV